MHCYYHPGRQAVGLCLHCQRGLCIECAELVQDVLACKNRHEGQVRAALQQQKREQNASRRAHANYLRNAVLYGSVGVVFAGYGLLEYRFLGLQAVLLLLVGFFLILGAAANLLESRTQD